MKASEVLEFLSGSRLPESLSIQIREDLAKSDAYGSRTSKPVFCETDTPGCVAVSLSDLAALCSSLEAGTLNAREIEYVASAIELDSTAFQPSPEAGEVLFLLANPDINFPLEPSLGRLLRKWCEMSEDTREPENLDDYLDSMNFGRKRPR